VGCALFAQTCCDVRRRSGVPNHQTYRTPGASSGDGPAVHSKCWATAKNAITTTRRIMAISLDFLLIVSRSRFLCPLRHPARRNGFGRGTGVAPPRNGRRATSPVGIAPSGHHGRRARRVLHVPRARISRFAAARSAEAERSRLPLKGGYSCICDALTAARTIGNVPKRTAPTVSRRAVGRIMPVESVFPRT